MLLRLCQRYISDEDLKNKFRNYVTNVTVNKRTHVTDVTVPNVENVTEGAVNNSMVTTVTSLQSLGQKIEDLGSSLSSDRPVAVDDIF